MMPKKHRDLLMKGIEEGKPIPTFDGTILLIAYDYCAKDMVSARDALILLVNSIGTPTEAEALGVAKTLIDGFLSEEYDQVRTATELKAVSQKRLLGAMNTVHPPLFPQKGH